MNHIRHIVMIEDDPGHALLTRRNLERSGINNPLLHIEDGKQAIDYFFNETNQLFAHTNSLILLDLNLPLIDGYEILERLKADRQTRDIPVIILITTDNPKEIDRCYALGCNVYIVKPVEYDGFTAAIRKLGLTLAATSAT